MHKTILNLFGFLKNCLQFVKILLIFGILMLLLYWIQNLTGGHWGWMGLFAPILDYFIHVGEIISSDSIKLFEAVFEYKYMIAVILFILLYAVVHFEIIGLEVLERGYSNGRQLAKKIEEDAFNQALKLKNSSEQSRLRKYDIYIETSIKKKYTNKEFNINIKEQNKIMNKFLMEQTGVSPQVFDNGFLYSFNDFNHIDKILQVFFKVINSDTPLNYTVCVQVLGANLNKEKEQLKKLIGLKFENKISMASDTAYRYKFNAFHRYGVSQLGLFQKENDTFEAHQFIEID